MVIKLCLWMMLASLSTNLFAQTAGGCRFEKKPPYVNGRLEGQYLCYHDEKMTKIRSRSMFKKGARQGREDVYHKTTGKIEFQFHYKNGVLDGLQKEFDHEGSGRLLEEETLKDGDREGVRRIYFTEGKEGRVQEEQTYRNDEFAGLQRKFYPSGARAEIRQLDAVLSGYSYHLNYFENNRLKSITLNRGEGYSATGVLWANYSPSGKLMNVSCQPPNQSLNTQQACEKAMKISLSRLYKKFK